MKYKCRVVYRVRSIIRKYNSKIEPNEKFQNLCVSINVKTEIYKSGSEGLF